MAYEGYERISFKRDGKVLTGTISNPPVNVITVELFAEIMRLSQELEADPETVVFVMKSADPDFFLAHFDVSALLQRDISTPVSRETSRNKPYHAMCRRFATMNTVTIAQIEGRVGGGGSEICMNFDMRFGVRGKTIVNQMEVPLGILPGGSGTQMLPRLIGRNRAMEVILGGVDMNAEDAERWGYLNRALPADEIGPYVDALAHRIASFPAESVRLAKQSINAAMRPAQEGLDAETYFFDQSMRTQGARTNMARFLAIGGQTREGEMQIADLNAKLGTP